MINPLFLENKHPIKVSTNKELDRKFETIATSKNMNAEALIESLLQNYIVTNRQKKV